MGMKKWLARKGTVGGTARWAGNGYFRIKRQDPDASVDDIMRELVFARYADESLATPRQALIEIIDAGDMRGIAHLVTNILSIEASYGNNTTGNRFLFMDVIQEELESIGVPSSDIYDPSKMKTD